MKDLKTEFDDWNVVVWDNGGETMDRYSILIDKQYVFSMSNDPTSPMGFNQYAGNINDWEVYSGFEHFIDLWDEKETRMKFVDIPEAVKEAIKHRMEAE